MPQADFYIGFGDCDNGVAGGFGTGAGGGGNGDHGGGWVVEGLCVSYDFEIGGEGLGVGEHGGEGFTHVDGAASAHGDDGAGAFFSSGLGEHLKVVGGGFALVLEWNEVLRWKGG